MSSTINRVELLGRVGTDPELRSTASGTALTKLRLATDRQRRNGPAATDWHTVICWGQLAAAVNAHVRVGQRLYVSGKLVQHRYEGPDGQHRSRTEVHAAEVVFLDSPHRANGGGATSPASTLAESEAADSPF